MTALLPTACKKAPTITPSMNVIPVFRNPFLRAIEDSEFQSNLKDRALMLAPLLKEDPISLLIFISGGGGMSSFSASVTQDGILDKPLHHTCRDISCFLRLLGP